MLKTVSSITIRNLDAEVKARLRVRAAANGRSMEQEAREILRSAVKPGREQELNLFDAIRRHFQPLGGVDLKLPRREAYRPRDLFGKRKA
jgi:plasmid stability protein